MGGDFFGRFFPNTDTRISEIEGKMENAKVKKDDIGLRTIILSPGICNSAIFTSIFVS